MADTEFTIKVTTEADTQTLEDIKSVLEEIKSNAELMEDGMNEALTSTTDGAMETSDSLEVASDSAENLGNSLDGINGSNLDDVSNSANDMADNMDRASESVNNLNDGMGVMEGSMMLSASEQIRGIGNSSEQMSQDLDNAKITLDQLAIQTGITEGELTSMINNISNETFPREEAMLYVQALDQVGVSSENLGESATRIDWINDAFHLGAEGTQKLTMEMGVLGVDLNDVESSYNALAYAQSNTLGGMQMYQRYMTRYSGDFAEYGYNIDQASVIIAGATQKWGGGRKAIGELNKALKESDGDVRALEEALDLEAGSLDNATQLTGEYEGKLVEMADQEMEHKTITERLGAVWEDFSLSLAPVLSPLGSVIGLLGQFGSFTLGINGIITLAETFGLLNKATLATIPSQIAEGTAGWFSIGWILVAVAVILILIGVLWYLYNNNEQVRQAIDNFAQTLQYVGGVIYSYFITALNNLMNVLKSLWNGVQTVINGLINAVNSGNGNIIQSIANVITYLSQLPMKLSTIFLNMIAKTLGFGDNFVQRMQQTAINSANNFINNITTLPSKLASELNEMLSVVSQWASTLPQKFWDAGVEAVMNFLNALDRHSPGIMQRQLTAELVEMGDNIPKDSRGLLKNISQMGSDVVDEFGNPSLELNSNGTLLNRNDDRGVYGNNYFTINIENVDNEERVNEIVEAVRKSLAWSNTTAGRTV